MVRAVSLVLALVACGDNRVVARDAAPSDDAPVIDAPVIDPDASDAPPPPLLPDLSLRDVDMTGTIQFEMAAFSPTSCEMLEQCIGAAGLRRLMRFDTVTQNLGTADLVVGVPPPTGVSEPPFEWSSCHDHHHFSGYATYDLLDGNGVVVSGHKQAFCILDTKRVTPGAPSQGYNCLNQGMSKGWADVYARNLPCQWIDVTGLPAGSGYTLRVRINPEQALVESDYTNNEFTMPITIP
jgi:hypothetical protein